MNNLQQSSRHVIELTVRLEPSARGWHASGTGIRWDSERMRGAGPADHLYLPRRAKAHPDGVMRELWAWASVTCWEMGWDRLWEAMAPWEQLELPFTSEPDGAPWEPF